MWRFPTLLGLAITCFLSWLEPSHGQVPGVDLNRCVPESLEPQLQIVQLSESFALTAQFPRDRNCLTAGDDIRLSAETGTTDIVFYSSLVKGDKWSIVLSEEHQSITFSIHGATAEDGRPYYVYKPGFSPPPESMYASVIVVTPPSHLAIPSASLNEADGVLEVVAREGRPLSISCSSSVSYPASVVTWFICNEGSSTDDCTELDTTQTSLSLNTAPYEPVKSTGVYRIFSANRTANGEMLMCRASQSVQGKGLVSREIYQLVRLNIQWPPSAAVNMATHYEFSQGDNSQPMKCAAVGSPQPTITWCKEELELTGANQSVEITAEDMIDGRKSLLTLRQISVGDFGGYVCHISNSWGSENVQYFVSEKEPVSQPLDMDRHWLYPIIGVCTAVTLVTIIIVVLVCCYRKRRNRQTMRDSSNRALSSGSSSEDYSIRNPAEFLSFDESHGSGWDAPVLPVVDARMTSVHPYKPVISGPGGTHVSFGGLDYPNLYRPQEDTDVAYTQRGTLPNAASYYADHHPNVQPSNLHSTFSNVAISNTSQGRGEDASNGFGNSLAHSQQHLVAPPEEF